MSEFRRFMCYIYGYKGSAKLHNTGFAKLEARGEVLRIQVHLKGVGNVKYLPCRVYGFFREEGFIKGILLGQLVLKNGMGDMMAVTDRNHLGNTDKCLEDLGGIYIAVGEEKDFAMASEWDNQAVNPYFFKVYEPSEGEKKVVPVKEKMNEKEIVEKWKVAGQEEYEGVSVEREVSVQEGMPVQKEVSEQKEVLVQEGMPVQKEVLEQKEVLIQEGVSVQGKVSEQNGISEKEEVSKQNEVLLKEQAVLCGEINLNVENFEKNKDKCEQSFEWKQLLKEYTTVHPFENCDSVEVIRIEPKDLSKLSKKYWVLGNNSFLLHGYCSYRYLILCKNKQEEKYFLGVPGVYHPREKIIAGMFGFNEFYMSRKGKLRHGEFGYYVRQVEL